MRLLAKLLAIVAATGVPGNAAAGIAHPVKDADSAATADPGARPAPAVPASYSFADIVDLPAGAEYRLLTAGGEPSSELSRISHPASARPGMVSSLNGALGDLSAHSSGARPAGSNPGAQILFPTDQIPEPSGWMLLLSGLALAGFMALRRRGPSPD